MLALLLVALSVGMSNFGAAVGIGVSGVDARTRLRVGLVFGAFEAGMPVLGLVIGHQAVGAVGGSARWIGAGLLIVIGAYTLVSAIRAEAKGAGRDRTGRRERDPASARRPTGRPPRAGVGRLLLSGLALSLDNLVVGFALGAYHTSVLVGTVTIAAVSVALSLIGLELGRHIARWAGERGEQLAGLILIGVGIAIAAGALS